MPGRRKCQSRPFHSGRIANGTGLLTWYFAGNALQNTCTGRLSVLKEEEVLKTNNFLSHLTACMKGE